MSVEETKATLLSILERGGDYYSADVYGGRFVELKASLSGLKDTWSLWVYTGRERDYLLIPYTYCSCMDFLIRTVSMKTRTHCKHQVGLLIAMKKRLFKTINVTLEELYVIVTEILESGFSATLRRKLYR
jgi:predicted nucleic acid-binding Zn finger protein